MATKKTTAKKSPAKKSPARKTAAKRASASDDGTTGGDAPAEEPAKKTAKKSAPRKAAAKKTSSAPRAQSSPRKRTGPVIAAEAARQLVELTGRDVEGVTSMQRTDDGWLVEVEVLEVRRIPDTTDVLATYELTLDEDGDIEGYRRVHRYVRGTPGEEQRR